MPYCGILARFWPRKLTKLTDRAAADLLDHRIQDSMTVRHQGFWSSGLSFWEIMRSDHLDVFWRHQNLTIGTGDRHLSIMLFAGWCSSATSYPRRYRRFFDAARFMECRRW